MSGEKFTKVDTWLEPVEIGKTKNLPRPFPLDAVPEAIRDAITDTRKKVGVPVELAVSGVLGTLSATIQERVNVQRNENIDPSPVSLILVTLVESGGRKTSASGQTKKTIVTYEDEQRERVKKEMAEFKSAHRLWTIQAQGIESAIKSGVSGKKRGAVNIESLQKEYEALMKVEPVKPLEVKICYEDVTTEALALNLSKLFPSAYLETSEGSSFFGSYATKDENSKATFSFICKMWDGGSFHQDRIGREAVRVINGRLTLNVSIQPKIFSDVLWKRGDEMRHIGLFARCLLCMPSDEFFGTRKIDPKQLPTETPGLDAFNWRIHDILNQPRNLDQEGVGNLPCLKLSPGAYGAWVRFYNEIEDETKRGGEFEEFRDVASKTADNASRIAGLFQYFLHDAEEEINEETMTGACEIARWYLHEQMRIFGVLSEDSSVKDVRKLLDWMVGRCRERGGNKLLFDNVRATCPRKFRQTEKLKAALSELQELHCVKIFEKEKGRPIEINPKLLKAK